MTVGERIKKIREEKGLTQDDLARLLGFSGRSAVCKAETSGDSITTKSLQKYAKALNVTEARLLGWSDEESEAFEQGAKDAELILQFHALTPDHQEMIMKQISLFLEMQ